MNIKFSRFAVDIANFCEKRFHKIRVVFVSRLNLLQYLVYFVRV
jgi:hypothetical protein